MSISGTTETYTHFHFLLLQARCLEQYPHPLDSPWGKSHLLFRTTRCWTKPYCQYSTVFRSCVVQRDIHYSTIQYPWQLSVIKYQSISPVDDISILRSAVPQYFHVFPSNRKWHLAHSSQPSIRGYNWEHCSARMESDIVYTTTNMEMDWLMI